MKIGLVSLGCPKNLVDSEVMLGLAERAGHSLTADPADADVLVVNTCAFVGDAKRESIDAILEMAGHKGGAPGRRLIVAGCLAERYREQLKAEIPEIDDIVGIEEVPDIVAAIEGRAPRGGAATLTIQRRAPESPSHPASPTYLYDARTPRRLTTPDHYAYVKVAEGCNYACSFCVIPSLRGGYRSRPARSIVDEARALAAGGVRELLLISQDTTFYGVDRGERHALADLLRKLNRVEGLEWIRLLYLYPTTITDETLAAMADCDKVCRYVDLPLQHASTSVLKRMKRPGGRASYERLLDRIRRRLPGAALRSTFIVGFPGETREEFAELVAFVEEQAFDHLGVFTYSHEEGTSAFRLRDDVAARVKRQRRGAVMSLQRRLVARANRGRKGERVRVLVDGPDPETPLVWRGRLSSQAPEIDPVVYLTNADPSALVRGRLVPAEIVGCRGYDLVARPLPASDAA